LSGAGGPGLAFPWREASAFCLGFLRWTPDAFWRATPREIAAALDAIAPRGEAPDRTALAALMAAFPDGRRDACDAPHQSP
jgi:uncharacterized phage protein (TIGR02216 family)